MNQRLNVFFCSFDHRPFFFAPLLSFDHLYHHQLFSFSLSHTLWNKLVDGMKMLANESEFRVKVAVRVSQWNVFFLFVVIDFICLGSTFFTTRKKSWSKKLCCHSSSNQSNRLRRSKNIQIWFRLWTENSSGKIESCLIDTIWSVGGTVSFVCRTNAQ